MTVIAPRSAVSAAKPKRFHVRGIPKKWIDEGVDEWKLFEAVSDLVLVDNVGIHESKQYSDSYFGVLDVVRSSDVEKLTGALDAKERLHLAGEKCHLTIRKFREARPKSAARLTYSREEMLQLQHKSVRPPRILASVYPFIKKGAAAKSMSPPKKN